MKLSPNPDQQQSPWHESDARLCQFIDTTQSLSLQNSDSNSPHYEAPALLRKAFYAKAADLASEHIWMIARRWKAVKSLYLRGYICERLVCSTLRNKTPTKTEFYQINCLGPCCEKNCKDGIKSTFRKSATFTDFYQRCIGVWLAFEAEALMDSFWDV